MNRFRQLLAACPNSTPGDEQKRASAGLGHAVRQSTLLWKDGKHPLPGNQKCLLLAVAPYSQYDLVLLDVLEEEVDIARPGVPIYVANLLEYGSARELGQDFPGIGQVHQTPMATLFEEGKATIVALGNECKRPRR